MAPRLVLHVALAIVETGCDQALQKNDTALLVRLMDLIKREMDLHDAKLIAVLNAKLEQPEYADVLKLWGLAHLAGSQRHTARGKPDMKSGA
jgi:hypothetical protein